MSYRTPKQYVYKNNNATLIIGYDETGRLFSYIQKAGEIVARDMFVKMPTEATLANNGWVRDDGD